MTRPVITLIVFLGIGPPVLATSFSFSTFSSEGLEILPTTCCVGFSIPSLGNEGPNPITLGDFDPITGNVIGGDAVLVAYLNIGNAPLTRLLTPDMEVNPVNPIDSGVVASGIVLPPNTSPYIGFSMAPMSLNAPLGNRSTIFVGFALFTSASQSLAEVPGVTLPIEILIGSRTVFIGTVVKTFSSIGGAQTAVFGGAQVAGIPEPSTVLLFAIGLVGIIGIGRQRRQANKG